MAAVIPEKPDHVPMARPLLSSSNEALMIASDPGTSNAPPTPCTARATISCSGLLASPHNTEAAANMTTPRVKMRLRP